MKKSVCTQKGSWQHQEQVDTAAQFLMQSTLNGVLQQLERIERVVEGVRRAQPMKRSKVGDLNHTSAEDNFQALKTKLMAFSSLHNVYGGAFQGSATTNVYRWIELRPKTDTSPAFARALLDTLDACEGRYQPTVQPVEMNEETLRELSSRLATAAHHWHEKEDKFHRDPQAYDSKPQTYRIEAGVDLQQYDGEAIKNKLERDALSEQSVSEPAPHELKEGEITRIKRNRTED